MKKFMTAAGFFLVLILVLMLSSIYVAHRKYVRGVRVDATGIQAERKNSIDYIVLGDSETYTSIIPLEIYNDYGYTGYILGTPAQRLSQTKELLESSLENQKPKLLVLETNAIFRKKKTKNAKATLRVIFEDLYELHDTWKYYVNPNYKTYSGNEKGYVYSTKIKKPKIKVKKHTKKKAKIPDYNIKILEEIMDICEENDIEILLVSTPSYKNWNYKKHNSMVEIAKKYDLNFIDLNLDDRIIMDWEKDTQDEGDHLNFYGAYKNTKILSEYLHNLGVLEDHRGDKNYREWDDSFAKYQLKFSNE